MKDYTKYLTCRYQRGGRIYPYLDCYGLFLTVSREVFQDNRFPDFKESGALGAAHGAKQADDLAKSNGISKLDKPKDGAFVQMLSRIGIPGHCGIVVNKDMVLHIDEDGARMETIASLKNRITGYYG